MIVFTTGTKIIINDNLDFNHHYVFLKNIICNTLPSVRTHVMCVSYFFLPFSYCTFYLESMIYGFGIIMRLVLNNINNVGHSG